MLAGLVEADGFDDERAGYSAEQVRRDMASMLPRPLERAFTPGDYAHDNLLMAGCKVTGRND